MPEYRGHNQTRPSCDIDPLPITYEKYSEKNLIDS